MPDVSPPSAPPSNPLSTWLPAGVTLHRIHDLDYQPLDFNPTLSSNPYKGGRFDCADASNQFSYLYAGQDLRAAVAEVLLRDSAPDAAAVIPMQKVRRARWSTITTQRDVELVQLHGAGLHAVGQHDGWVTSCPSGDYAKTRLWGDAIRTWAPDAKGFVWRCRHDDDRFAYVLFGDRVLMDDFTHGRRRTFNSVSGRAALEAALDDFGATTSA